MPTTDKRIDAYIAKAQPFAKPIITRLRQAIHAGCPDVVETIKWGMPAFEYKGPLAGMAAFKKHCTFGFWKGSLMQTVPKDRVKDAMGQFGRFESLDDVSRQGVSVGLQTIADAKALRLVIHGADKQHAIERLLSLDSFDPDWPVSIGHDHHDARSRR